LSTDASAGPWLTGRLPNVGRVLLSSRSSDDADVIRARLRALLAESSRPGGWTPQEDIEENPSAAELGTDPESDLDPDSEPALESQSEEALPSGIGRHRAPGSAVRLDPGHRGAWSLWAAGLLAALLVAGWTWLDRPQVEPVPSSSAAAPPTVPRSAAPSPPVGEAAQTSSTVVVSVVGQVRRPGLVTLASGARVADALQAAGGLMPGADAASVNLAAVVADGQQIAVGVPGTGVSPGTGGAAGASAGPSGPAARVNLNTATAADLDALPGIGPVLAQRIVDYRDQQGRFTSVDQLDDVPGIGPAIAEQLAKLVTV
jgi:competence protein ComEA